LWNDGCNECKSYRADIDAAECTRMYCKCYDDNSCVPVCRDNGNCVPANSSGNKVVVVSSLPAMLLHLSVFGVMLMF
jgi:hypothetical protein